MCNSCRLALPVLVCVWFEIKLKVNLLFVLVKKEGRKQGFHFVGRAPLGKTFTNSFPTKCEKKSESEPMSEDGFSYLCDQAR